MISNEFAIELSSWALSLEKTRANISAENIANANITGQVSTVSFESLISSIEQAIESNDLKSARELFNVEPGIVKASTTGPFGGVALDREVADLSSAQGRYKVIAEALSRKFGLMSIALTGRE